VYEHWLLLAGNGLLFHHCEYSCGVELQALPSYDLSPANWKEVLCSLLCSLNFPRSGMNAVLLKVPDSLLPAVPKLGRDLPIPPRRLFQRLFESNV